MTAVTRSMARRADLGSVRAATTQKNKKVATASVGARIQKRKRPARIQKRKRPASVSSEGTGVAKAAAAAAAGKKTLGEASFILKLKKEAYGAVYLWEQRHAPGALERWVKAKARQAKAEEAQPKKMPVMVTKIKLSRQFIDCIRSQQPGLIKDLPDEELAVKSETFRRHHAMMKYINAKMYAYHQALIDQYMSQGYAEDEEQVEVTDAE